MNSINFQKIRMRPKANPPNEISDRIHYECRFCTKASIISGENVDICKKLSQDHLFCTFCLRNGFSTKNSQHVFILSFKGIIGYYYHYLYYNKKMWFSEILDMISTHESVGLQNPIFYYDHDSFLWFVDFSKIGKKINLDDIMRTIVNIVFCFNPHENISDFGLDCVLNEYRIALERFYTHRTRPEGKILTPILYENNFDDNLFRFFNPKDLVIN